MLINELASRISYYNTNINQFSDLQISDIYDYHSDSSDFLNNGSILEISGKNLTIMGDNPIIGLYFINVYDSSKIIKLNKSELIQNSSSLLICQIPLTIKNGVYNIMIVTELVSSGNSITSYIFDKNLFALN